MKKMESAQRKSMATIGRFTPAQDSAGEPAVLQPFKSLALKSVSSSPGLADLPPEPRLIGSVVADSGIQETPQWKILSPPKDIQHQQTVTPFNVNEVIVMPSTTNQRAKQSGYFSATSLRQASAPQEPQKKYSSVYRRKGVNAQKALSILSRKFQGKSSATLSELSRKDRLFSARVQNPQRIVQQAVLKPNKVGVASTGMLKLEVDRTRAAASSALLSAEQCSTNRQTDFLSQAGMATSDDIRAYLSHQIDMFSPVKDSRPQGALAESCAQESKNYFETRFRSQPQNVARGYLSHQQQLLQAAGSQVQSARLIQDFQRPVFTSNGHNLLDREAPQPLMTERQALHGGVLSAKRGGGAETTYRDTPSAEPSQRVGAFIDRCSTVELGQLQGTQSAQSIASKKTQLFSHIATQAKYQPIEQPYPYQYAQTTQRGARKTNQTHQHLMQTFDQVLIQEQIRTSNASSQPVMKDQFGSKKLISSHAKERLMSPSQLVFQSQSSRVGAFSSPHGHKPLTANLFEHTIHRKESLSRAQAIMMSQGAAKKAATTCVKVPIKGHQDPQALTLLERESQRSLERKSGQATPELVHFTEPHTLSLQGDRQRQSNSSNHKGEAGTKGALESARTSCLFQGNVPGDAVPIDQRRSSIERAVYNANKSIGQGSGISSQHHTATHQVLLPLEDSKIDVITIRESQSSEHLLQQQYSTSSLLTVDKYYQSNGDLIEVQGKTRRMTTNKGSGSLNKRRPLVAPDRSKPPLVRSQFTLQTQQSAQDSEQKSASKGKSKIKMLHRMPPSKKESSTNSRVSIGTLRKNWRGILPTGHIQKTISKDLSQERLSHARAGSQELLHTPQASQQALMPRRYTQQVSKPVMRKAESGNVFFQTMAETQSPQNQSNGQTPQIEVVEVVEIIDQTGEANYLDCALQVPQTTATLKPRANTMIPFSHHQPQRKASDKKSTTHSQRASTIKSQQKVLSFNYSPSSAKRGLSPELTHVLELPLEAHLGKPGESLLVSPGSPTIQPASLRDQDPAAPNSDLQFDSIPPAKHQQLRSGSKRSSEGLLKAMLPDQHSSAAKEQPSKADSSMVKITLEENEQKMVDRLFKQTEQQARNETPQLLTPVKSQAERLIRQQQSAAVQVPDQVSRPYIYAHLKTQQHGRELTKQVNAFKRQLRQTGHTQSLLEFSKTQQASIAGGKRAKAPWGVNQGPTAASKLSLRHRTVEQRAEVGATATAKKSLESDFITTMEAVTKDRARKIDAVALKQSQRILRFKSQQMLTPSKGGDRKVPKVQVNDGTMQSVHGNHQSSVLMNKEMHEKLQAMPQTGRLTRLQADPFKQLIQQSMNGEKIQADTVAAIQREFEHSVDIEKFFNKTIYSQGSATAAVGGQGNNFLSTNAFESLHVPQDDHETGRDLSGDQITQPLETETCHESHDETAPQDRQTAAALTKAKEIGTNEKFLKYIEEKLEEEVMKLPKPRTLNLNFLNKEIAEILRKQKYSCQSYSICRSPKGGNGKGATILNQNNDKERQLQKRLKKVDKAFKSERVQVKKSLNDKWMQVRKDYCIDFDQLAQDKERLRKKGAMLQFQQNMIELSKVIRSERFPISVERLREERLTVSEQSFKNFLRDVKFGDLESVLKRMVKEPLIVFQTDEMRQTALVWAVKRRNYLMARFLIKNFVRVNYKDITGRTALNFAVDQGDLDMIKILLCYQADPMSTNSEGKSILGIYDANTTKETNLEIGQVLRLAKFQLERQSLIQNGWKIIQRVRTLVQHHAEHDEEFRSRRATQDISKMSSWTKQMIKDREWRIGVLSVLDPHNKLEEDELLDFN